MTNNALSGSNLGEAIAQDLWPSASADGERWWYAHHELRAAAHALSLAGLSTESDALLDMADLALHRTSLAPVLDQLPGGPEPQAMGRPPYGDIDISPSASGPLPDRIVASTSVSDSVF